MDNLVALCTSDDDWTSLGEEKGVRIHQRSIEGNPIVMLRGITDINVSPKEILDATADLENRSKWDKMFLGGSYPKEIDEKHHIVHLKFKSPSFMVSNRDICLVRAIKELDDGAILSNHVSVECDDCPEEKGFVRAEASASGFWIKGNNEGGATIAYVIQLDPKGWIPNKIVNLVAKEQPLILACLRNYLENK